MTNKIIEYTSFTAIRNAHKTGEYILKDTSLSIRNAHVKLFSNAVSQLKNCNVIGADDSITIAKESIQGIFVDNSIVLCQDSCVNGSVSLFDGSSGIVTDNTNVVATDRSVYLRHKEVKEKQEKFRELFDGTKMPDNYYCISFQNSCYNNIICVKGYENIEWLMELFVTKSKRIYINEATFYRSIVEFELCGAQVSIVPKDRVTMIPILMLDNNVLMRI